jgi:hypothetical protein
MIASAQNPMFGAGVGWSIDSCCFGREHERGGCDASFPKSRAARVKPHTLARNRTCATCMGLGASATLSNPIEYNFAIITMQSVYSMLLLNQRYNAKYVVLLFSTSLLHISDKSLGCVEFVSLQLHRAEPL